MTYSFVSDSASCIPSSAQHCLFTFYGLSPGNNLTVNETQYLECVIYSPPELRWLFHTEGVVLAGMDSIHFCVIEVDRQGSNPSRVTPKTSCAMSSLMRGIKNSRVTRATRDTPKSSTKRLQ